MEAACRRYMARAETTLNDKAFLFGKYGNSHLLPGALATVAECGRTYPGILRTEKPWRQSLDAAWFI